MQQLNFPSFSFRFKNSENKLSIFDEIRKKFIILTPEEWVRQHALAYLIYVKKYSKNYINVEKSFIINKRKKRYDIVVYKPDGTIFLLVECKAPTIGITQDTFNQIAQYNVELKAEYLWLTNGLEHFYCQMNFTEKKFVFISELP